MLPGLIVLLTLSVFFFHQIRQHCTAFRNGLADVVNIDWLRMFNSAELQVLISGAPVPIDLQDLRQHTNYSGERNTLCQEKENQLQLLNLHKMKDCIVLLR